MSLKQITGYDVSVRFDNKICIVKKDRQGRINLAYAGKDVTMEAIYSVIRHIEKANINNELITYKEDENGQYVPEYKLTLEKLGED